MYELTLQLDDAAIASIKKLMKHYNITDRADLFKKGLAVLSVAAYVGKTGGEIYARNGDKETKLNIN